MIGQFFDTMIVASTDKKYYYSHQTYYEKSDWWRAFNQFTIACELDMIIHDIMLNLIQ